MPFIGTMTETIIRMVMVIVACRIYEAAGLLEIGISSKASAGFDDKLQAEVSELSSQDYICLPLTSLGC